jgi:hypothetical protein
LFCAQGGGNCDAVATEAVVFAWDGGGGDSVGCFVSGDGGNCDAVATMAVVFFYYGDGNESLCCFVPGDGAIVMLYRRWRWFSLIMAIV